MIYKAKPSGNLCPSQKTEQDTHSDTEKCPVCAVPITSLAFQGTYNPDWQDFPYTWFSL